MADYGRAMDIYTYAMSLCAIAVAFILHYMESQMQEILLRF